MTLAESLGIAFRQCRNDKQISQMDLAAAIDMERSSISAIENGRQNISMNVFLRLCDGLNIDPRAILDDALKRMGR